MAALTKIELAGMRRGICRGESPNFTSTEIDIVLQNVEDYMTAHKSEIASLLIGNADIKRKTLARYFEFKFNQDK
jgi:hypothetical protein